MQHTFEYFHVTTAMDSINVEDIGECALEICNDADWHWYMLIHTYLGDVYTLSFGPVTSDYEIVRDKFALTTNQMPYIENRIIKGIEHWIEDPKKLITQAFELDDPQLVIDILNKLDFITVFKA